MQDSTHLDNIRVVPSGFLAIISLINPEAGIVHIFLLPFILQLGTCRTGRRRIVKGLSVSLHSLQKSDKMVRRAFVR